MKNIIIIVLLMALVLSGCASKEQGGNATLTSAPGAQSIPSVQPTTTNTTNQSANVSQENITSKIADYNLSTTFVNSTDVGENLSENEKQADALKFGKYILMLDDVVVVGNQNCASIRIFDSSLTMMLHQGLACEGKDYYWTAPDKHKYRILVTEVAAGYSNNSIWAKVFIYG